MVDYYTHNPTNSQSCLGGGGANRMLNYLSDAVLIHIAYQKN